VIKLLKGCDFMGKDKNLRHAIVKSAFKQFSEQPFKKVSTNEIVDGAGVSKGLLFHYFKDKKTLYISLYDIAWQTLHKDIIESMDFENHCLFARLKDFMITKSKVLKSHKTLANFLKNVHLNQDVELTKKRLAIYHKHQEKVYKFIFDGIDKTAFREDLNLTDSYRVITWTIQRITHEWEKNHSDKENSEAISILEHELSHYISFLQKAFYQ